MKDKMTFWTKTKRFLSPLSQDKMVYFWWILIYFMWSFDRVVHILFLERVVYFLELGKSDSFFLILKIYITYIVFYTIFTTLSRRKWWTEIWSTVSKFLQNIYLKKYVQLNNNYTEKYGTGKLTAIINNGIDRWGELIDMFLHQMIGILVSFVFTCYMLYQSNFFYVIVFISLYFVFYVISYFLNLWAIKYRKKRRDYSHNHTKNFIKVLMNKHEILQSDKITHEIQILDSYDNKQIFYNKKIADFLQPLFEWPNIVSSIAIIFLLYFLWNSYLNGNITLSVIVGIISVLVMMKDAIDKGIIFFKDFTKNFVDIEKLWEFFDEAPKIERYDIWKTFLYKKGEIFLENISYSYVAGKNILENFSLDLEWWKITALVGPSGWGKSTIAKLVWGYLEASSWEIFVDWQKLSDFSLKSYYKNIWYLTQEPSVFDGTVLENLTYALIPHPWIPSPSREREAKKSFLEWVEIKQGEGVFSSSSPAGWGLHEIIKLAKCEFVYELPHGLETEIGERGVKLSWGQRQRLAIAKIMLKNPKIIILDEPTSALDSFSEE